MRLLRPVTSHQSLVIRGMPNLAQFHPQVVHFVVVLMLMGVAFRLVSLTGRFKFTDHAAAVMLIVGAVASYIAYRSGLDAHGPVERIPGARALVQEHELQGIKAFRLFVVIAIVEAIALGLAWRASLARFARYAHVASALLGLWGCQQVYHASEHGGELVYNYAGGPGLRSGRPEDVERLLLAGLYNQSRNDRRAGKLADAAALNAEMLKRFGSDTTVQFLNIESLLLDSKNPSAALAAANALSVVPTDARFAPRKAHLRADIFIAMGKRDSARAALAEASTAFPQNARLKARLDSLK
jgi:uncharacterized membrane protein